MWRTLTFESIYYASFKTFEPDRLKFQNFGHMICGHKNVFVTDTDESSVLRAVN